jgi:hypothetical protein
MDKKRMNRNVAVIGEFTKGLDNVASFTIIACLILEAIEDLNETLAMRHADIQESIDRLARTTE